MLSLFEVLKVKRYKSASNAVQMIYFEHWYLQNRHPNCSWNQLISPIKSCSSEIYEKRLSLCSDQWHSLIHVAFVFVDIPASYWWIYYLFDGCHKTQWGELWWKWYMLMYLICICIFIGPWCNRVWMKSIICKHFSMFYDIATMLCIL